MCPWLSPSLCVTSQNKIKVRKHDSEICTTTRGHTDHAMFLQLFDIVLAHTM